MQRRTLGILIGTFFVIILFLAGLRSVERTAYRYKPYIKRGIVLDTFVSIKAYGEDRRKIEQAVQAAFAEMARIEKITNRYDSKSEVSKLNKRAGRGWVKVSKDLFELIHLARNYGDKSAGAFDITIAPVLDLWGFDKKAPVIPDQVEIVKKLKQVDYHRIELNKKDRKVRMPLGFEIDLGGLAKGYAVDQAVKILERANVEAALVDTGSTVRSINLKPGKKLWQVGIQHPRKKEGEIMAIVNLKAGMSLSTSGDYQQYFIKNGRRYHHIINPSTGYPVGEFMTVVVLTKRSAVEADILSTALFAMGRKRAERYLAENPDVQAIFIGSDGKVNISQGMKQYIKKIPTRIRS
jgi:thiamine biosynthesis lipoprotein